MLENTEKILKHDEKHVFHLEITMLGDFPHAWCFLLEILHAWGWPKSSSMVISREILHA